MYEHALGQLLAALISPASRRGIKGEFEDIVSYRVFLFLPFQSNPLGRFRNGQRDPKVRNLSRSLQAQGEMYRCLYSA